MTAEAPIKGADAKLWEAHPPEPKCTCGTPGFYRDATGRWYCPSCWRTAGYLK